MPLNTIMTEKIKNNSFSDFLEVLKKYFLGEKEIMAAYLFGSLAAGKAAPFSDVDIALLTPPAENRIG